MQYAMSDSSSVCSCSSCDSGSFEEPSSSCTIFKTKKRNVKKQVNILQSIHNREIGLSETNPKFPVVPDRLKFPLRKILPSSSLSSHVFLGLSKCGQLLITYTSTAEVDDRHMSFNDIYKYRLHWWAFVPYAQARKVAEVTLFGNHSVYTPLFLSVCQWPTDSSRIVVHGNCSETFVGLVGQTERSYVTITAVPSLHNCMECQKVAASFEEEDIAASWDSCVRFSCLVHGLTVHTSFDVAPPYPRFQPIINMKYNGRVVLNSGNFLHIIHVDLENTFRGSRAPKSPHESCHVQSDNFTARARTFATSNVNVRMSEYHTLLGLAPSSPFASSSDHNSCDNRSLLEELNITCQPSYIGSSSNLYYRPDLLMLETDSDASSQISSILSPPLKRRGYHLLSPNASPRGQQVRLNTKADAGKAYEFTGKDERIYETLSSFRRRRLAEKKYEFSEEDFEDSENIVPFRLIRRAEGAVMQSSTHHHPPSSLSRDRSMTRPTGSIGEPPDLLSNHRRRTDNSSATLDVELDLPSTPGINVDLSLDQDKVVLRPQNRNHALLSPREQDIRDPPREANKKIVQVHLENNSLSLPPGPMHSPPQNHQQTSQASERSEKVVSSSSTINASQSTGGTASVSKTSGLCGCTANSNAVKSEVDLKGGCTVQFERRFIEVDDELVSVITDIEDDDESGSTGYHSALPLEVHGSGYVQMQMISNSKAEKLMAPCALVHQMSFDIEQFCHEVAAKLCERAGMKFWYCNNYDVEVVDVCAQTGDVICLAFLKIKATVKTKKGAPKCDRFQGERQQYQTCCLLVWNMNTGLYRLEKSSVLEKLEGTPIEEMCAADICDYREPDSPVSGDDWNPARKVAQEIRQRNYLHCKAANQPQVRVLTNAPVCKGQSYNEIINEEHGISFVL